MTSAASAEIDVPDEVREQLEDDDVLTVRDWIEYQQTEGSR